MEYVGEFAYDFVLHRVADKTCDYFEHYIGREFQDDQVVDSYINSFVHWHFIFDVSNQVKSETEKNQASLKAVKNYTQDFTSYIDKHIPHFLENIDNIFQTNERLHESLGILNRMKVGPMAIGYSKGYKENCQKIFDNFPDALREISYKYIQEAPTQEERDRRLAISTLFNSQLSDKFSKYDSKTSQKIKHNVDNLSLIHKLEKQSPQERDKELNDKVEQLRQEINQKEKSAEQINKLRGSFEAIQTMGRVLNQPKFEEIGNIGQLGIKCWESFTNLQKATQTFETVTSLISCLGNTVGLAVSVVQLFQSQQTSLNQQLLEQISQLRKDLSKEFNSVHRHLDHVHSRLSKEIFSYTRLILEQQEHNFLKFQKNFQQVFKGQENILRYLKDEVRAHVNKVLQACRNLNDLESNQEIAVRSLYMIEDFLLNYSFLDSYNGKNLYYENPEIQISSSYLGGAHLAIAREMGLISRTDFQVLDLELFQKIFFSLITGYHRFPHLRSRQNVQRLHEILDDNILFYQELRENIGQFDFSQTYKQNIFPAKEIASKFITNWFRDVMSNHQDYYFPEEERPLSHRVGLDYLVNTDIPREMGFRKHPSLPKQWRKVENGDILETINSRPVSVLGNTPEVFVSPAYLWRYSSSNKIPEDRRPENDRFETRTMFMSHLPELEKKFFSEPLLKKACFLDHVRLDLSVERSDKENYFDIIIRLTRGVKGKYSPSSTIYDQKDHQKAVVKRNTTVDVFLNLPKILKENNPEKVKASRGSHLGKYGDNSILTFINLISFRIEDFLFHMKYGDLRLEMDKSRINQLVRESLDLLYQRLFNLNAQEYLNQLFNQRMNLIRQDLIQDFEKSTCPKHIFDYLNEYYRQTSQFKALEKVLKGEQLEPENLNLTEQLFDSTLQDKVPLFLDKEGFQIDSNGDYQPFLNVNSPPDADFNIETISSLELLKSLKNYLEEY